EARAGQEQPAAAVVVGVDAGAHALVTARTAVQVYQHQLPAHDQPQLLGTARVQRRAGPRGGGPPPSGGRAAPGPTRLRRAGGAGTVSATRARRAGLFASRLSNNFLSMRSRITGPTSRSGSSDGWLYVTTVADRGRSSNSPISPMVSSRPR